MAEERRKARESAKEELQDQLTDLKIARREDRIRRNSRSRIKRPGSAPISAGEAGVGRHTRHGCSARTKSAPARRREASSRSSS